MARRKEEVTVQPVSVWGQPLEAVFVQIIPPANQEEADQDFYERCYSINSSDHSFLYIKWQFSTGKYRIANSEKETPSFERLSSPEWQSKIGEAMINPEYQQSNVDRDAVLKVRENVSDFTLLLLFFGKNKFRQIIREAGLTKEERDFICGQILFEVPTNAWSNDHAFVNNLVYSLNRGKF